MCLLCGAWGGGGDGPTCEAWSQWGQGADHDGQVCVDGQRGLRMLARLVVDPFAAQETEEAGGSLLVHYPAPLTDDEGNVFVLEKGGEFHVSQVWMLRAYAWRGDELVPRWTFASDWQPIPTPWEPMFQAALGEDSVFIPGAGGTVFEVDKRSGRTLRRINPFGDVIDPLTWTTSGVTIDRKGDIFYNVLKIELGGPIPDGHGWLVRADRHGRVRTVDYRTLIPGAPAATDLCFATYNAMVPVPPRPWPPLGADGAPLLPPQFPCGSQRAGINVTPAIGQDGTIFTVTRAHGGRANDYAYIVALRPDLSLKWATSLRGHLDDGCGVLVDYGAGPFNCREGAPEGIDFATGMPPAGQASDIGSSSPVALPDGGVLYGAFTGYNGFRGHLFKLDRRGRFRGAYDFGWDVTPAVVDHRGHGYSIVVKDNHYFENGPFLVTQLDEDLDVEWQFANTSTETCVRQPDGTVECEDTGEHPNGFEWCINAPAVDRSGTVYGLNEDGYMYAIDRHGREVERVFLTRTLSAAYTPLAIDSRGRIYAQNNGEIYVLGR